VGGNNISFTVWGEVVISGGPLGRRKPIEFRASQRNADLPEVEASIPFLEV